MKQSASLRTPLFVAAFLLAASLSGPLQAQQPTDDILFIHHSVGNNWMHDGLRSALPTKDYIDEANESYYGTLLSANPGRPESLGTIPGDRTDMCHWLFWFNDYLPAAKQLNAASGQNRIIMFKSCYPNSGITADGAPPGTPFSTTSRLLESYKAIYRRAANATEATYTRNGYLYRPLEEIFAENPDTLFIAVTAPPLNYDAVSYPGANDDYAARARAFNNWLKNDWLPSYRARNPGLNNVAVFDLFDVLAVPADASTGHPNRLRPEYIQANNPTDSHPNTTANQRLTELFATGPDAFIDTAWAAFTAGTPLPADTTPPTQPTGLAGAATTSTVVAISWISATDPSHGTDPVSGVAGYRLYRDGLVIGTVATTSYEDTGLSPSTTYSYAVASVDAAGNASPPCAAITVTTQAAGATRTSGIALGETWRYFKGTVQPPTGWNTPDFDDSAWAEGAMPIGYGSTPFATPLADMPNGYLTVYCRKAFTLAPGTVQAMALTIDFDDGCIAYLNGTEIYRNGVSGEPLHNTPATGTHEEGNPITVDLASRAGLLVAGENLLAVYASNTAIMSSDFAATASLAITTTIDDASATFATWRTDNFTGEDFADDSVSGPDADPGAAGVTNFQRYAFALPARGPVVSPVTLGTADTAAGRVLTLTFPRRAAASDLSYVVESSDDLVTWTPVPGLTYSPGAGPITAEDVVAMGAATRRFLHVRVQATL